MNERRKTFGADPDPSDAVDAAAFRPRPIVRPDPETARRVAEEGGYTSGATTRPSGDSQRRHRTGRTAQLNVKVTPECRARFAAMADAAGISQNALFEKAIAALQAIKDANER